MIPKIIHYVWLGNKELPAMVKKCIKSWKKYCPDYEIKRWDETNLDIDCCKYCRDAYDAKKYAFASDVLRFLILKNEGGIYLDVDVELLKPLDDLLEEKCFMGYECCGKRLYVAPGLIIGSEKNGKVVSEIYQSYLESSFYVGNDINYETVCVRTTNILIKNYNLEPNGRTVHFDDISIYAPEYFCPLDGESKEVRFLTEKTYSKHLYLASWVKKPPLHKRFANKMKSVLRKIIGKKNYNKLKQKVRGEK